MKAHPFRNRSSNHQKSRLPFFQRKQEDGVYAENSPQPFFQSQKSPSNIQLKCSACEEEKDRPPAVQRSPELNDTIQRELALQPPDEVRDQPDLTPERIERAIRYNRASYDEASTNQIQDLVGAEQTGSFDEQTVRRIAEIQRDYDLDSDGRVGPDTYDFLIRELQAEGVEPGNCLTLFQIDGPEPLRFFRTSGTQGLIGSRFFIRARFDPRCNCEDWEYRQYIAGQVVLRDNSGSTFDVSNRFDVPGGLTTSLTQDGDNEIPEGVAGHFYGHRNFSNNPEDINRDRYLPDRRTGCEYKGVDLPELGPVPASPGDTGDRYIWNMRFRGVIKHKDRGVVQEKYWAIRGDIPIP